MRRWFALASFATVILLAPCRQTPSGYVVGTGTLQQWGGQCAGVWTLRGAGQKTRQR